MPDEKKIHVRLRVLNLEYDKENKTIKYNLEVCKEQTFEILYNFCITISKNSIDRTNLKCSLTILDQIKEKIAIFDNYLQCVLRYDDEFITPSAQEVVGAAINTVNLGKFLKPYAWMDLNLGKQDES